MARRTDRWVAGTGTVRSMAASLVTLVFLVGPDGASAQGEVRPPASSTDRLRDRGEGVADVDVRYYAGLEGTQDEVTLIGEVQWHVSPGVVVKINNGVGVTSKATDWAPEVGVAFSFGRSR